MALLNTDEIMIACEEINPAELNPADIDITWKGQIDGLDVIMGAFKADKASPKRFVVAKRHPAQNLADKDKADGTEHVDKRVKENPKESPRPYMTRKILYNESLWIEWALQPFDLHDLIERRNKTGKRTFIHVASIYEKNGMSGFGYIIRDCHGTPLVAYSEYFDTKDIEPVSEFYLEMKAVDKSLEHAEELGIKIVSMVSTSCEVAYAVHDCYMGELCGTRINDKVEAKVTNLSGDIMDKLERRRNHDTNVFLFHIHQQTRDRSLNSAVCLVEAGLEDSRTVS